MSSASRLDKLVQYITVTATTVSEIAGNANVPFLEAAAMGTTAILNTVQVSHDRSNEEQVMTMLEKIHEILCAIIHLYAHCQTDGALPPALLYDIAKFTETLQKIYGFMKSQQGIGKIKQLFKQFDPATQLKAWEEELQGSLARFQLQTSGITINKVAEMQKDAQRQHEELLALLADHPDLTNSDSSSSVADTLSTFGNSSGSLSLLPPYPSIFHGRDRELSEVITSLKSDSARIAILGAGGMGKTSLSIAALHDPDVAKKFNNRYFVPCQSNATRWDLVLSIASHLLVAEGPNLMQKVVQHLMDGPPVLMILDNFETPWEPMLSRAAVEEVLSLLTDIPHLALVITMRGAERPGQVKWTRPFLQPLEPLEDGAALQTFHAIAGEDHEESLVHELLTLSGNLPLAIDLIANVVVGDGCTTTLDRWRTESTRVVSDGYDKRSSLNISITLSFSSARMTQESQALLSLLSILPNGLSDTELVHSNLPIADIRGAQTTLLRTALAQVGPTNRLSTLMPIREHVRGIYPP
ncbi:P-loop containing nucleoside triphosphate hydrolase protein, partial [Mycena pura]